MDVWDDDKGSATVNKIEKGVRSTYISHLRRNNKAHFETKEGIRGPLEVIFKKLEFKQLVFGTFGKMSEVVKDVLEIAVDYGAEHLGRCMAATIVEAVRVAVRRKYRIRLSMAAWKGRKGTPTFCLT
jgi:hypothetical protein